jgi:hypothetical protein
VNSSYYYLQTYYNKLIYINDCTTGWQFESTWEERRGGGRERKRAIFTATLVRVHPGTQGSKRDPKEIQQTN